MSAFTQDRIGFIRRKIIRPVLRFLIRFVLLFVARLEVHGKEYLPQKGPLIVIANHFNFLDPVLLIAILPYSTEFIGGTDLPGAPALVRFFPRLYGILKVHRGSVSRDALTGGEKMLAGGGVLSIFPEAGNWAQVLRPPRPGAALLAVRSGVPIVPLGLHYDEGIFPIKPGRRGRVIIKIGEPFGPYLEDIHDRAGRERLDEIGHLMMEKIKKLIPASRHGYYSEDPDVRLAAKGTEVYPWHNQVEN